MTKSKKLSKSKEIIIDKKIDKKIKHPKILLKVGLIFVTNLILQFYFLNPLIVLVYNLSMMMSSFLFLKSPEYVYILTAIAVLILTKYDPFSAFFYLSVIFLTLVLEIKRHFDNFLNFILSQTIMLSFFASIITISIILKLKEFYLFYEYFFYFILIPAIVSIVTFSLINYYILEPKANEKILLLKFFLKFGLKSLSVILIFGMILYFIFLTYYTNLIEKNIFYLKSGILEIEKKINTTYNIPNFNPKKINIFDESNLVYLLDYYTKLTIVSLKASRDYALKQTTCINVTVNNKKPKFNSKLYFIIYQTLQKFYITRYLNIIKNQTKTFVSDIACKN